MREYLADLSIINYDHKKTDPKKAEKVETALSEYILSQADTVRLTQREMRYGFLFKKKAMIRILNFKKLLKIFSQILLKKKPMKNFII